MSLLRPSRTGRRRECPGPPMRQRTTRHSPAVADPVRGACSREPPFGTHPCGRVGRPRWAAPGARPYRVSVGHAVSRPRTSLRTIACTPSTSWATSAARPRAARSLAASWLAGVWDELGLERAVFVGSSFGGFQATNLAVPSIQAASALSVLLAPAATAEAIPDDGPRLAIRAGSLVPLPATVRTRAARDDEQRVLPDERDRPPDGGRRGRVPLRPGAASRPRSPIPRRRGGSPARCCSCSVTGR